MRRRRFSYVWDDRRVARLRALLALGAERPDTSQIARELGVSDMAVRCKAYRLGCPLTPRRGVRQTPAPLPPSPNPLPIVAAALAIAPEIKPRVAHPSGASQAARAWPHQVATYVAHAELGFSLERTARGIGISLRRVRDIVQRIEERRDEDPTLDAFLDRVGDQAREAFA